MVDKFDSDISSQNGQASTHSLAMLITKSGPFFSDDIGVSETIQRTPKSDMAKPIESEIDIERFQVPKKPQRPVEMAQNRFCH